ncbi:MAG TPA: FAD binding domain-containing protein [Candidatus Dormibacteraeota bacterium]|nr:FAD binding domain-containing protein [Candidatus Dormibacteraeota bacterium]
MTARFADAADFVDARELAHALGTLQERGPEVTVLAGGTDVMVQYLRGDIRPRILLHVRRLAELKGMEFGARTTIGALTTHRELTTDARVLRAHPALAEAAATVGGRQTQNVGTIAGNVVNASPAADLLPALMVADAVVELTGATGTRRLPISDFVVGRRSTLRRPDELVTGFSLEPLPSMTAETYLKLGRRRAMEVAIVGLAVRLALTADGRVTDARIAVCSVGPRPFRAHQAEEPLIGSRLEEDAIREAGERLRQAAAPIDDLRATAAYRWRVLPPLLERAISTCHERWVASQDIEVDHGTSTVGQRGRERSRRASAPDPPGRAP